MLKRSQGGKFLEGFSGPKTEMIWLGQPRLCRGIGELRNPLYRIPMVCGDPKLWENAIGLSRGFLTARKVPRKHPRIVRLFAGAFGAELRKVDEVDCRKEGLIAFAREFGYPDIAVCLVAVFHHLQRNLQLAMDGSRRRDCFGSYKLSIFADNVLV